MLPPCGICKEVGEAHEACLLAAVTMSFGGTKVQKWMPVCQSHYNGGPCFLLVEVPEMFTSRREK